MRPAAVERSDAACEECRFGWAADACATIDALRSLPSRYEALLTAEAEAGRAARLRTRPEPHVWSQLEYAAHTRDAIAWYAERIARVLREDRPALSAFDWDAACDERRYADEDPTAVALALTRASENLADRLEGLDDDGWSRVGVGSDGGERTVLVLARRAVHESVHHLYDIRLQAAGREASR